MLSSLVKRDPADGAEGIYVHRECFPHLRYSTANRGFILSLTATNIAYLRLNSVGLQKSANSCIQ